MEHFLCLLILLSPLSALSEEIHVAIGMDRDAAIALIKKHGAKDITPGLAVVGPNGEHPLRGIYWEFQEYDAIIGLAVDKDRITAMGFWSKDDFGKNKSHRAKSEREITDLFLDTQKKSVSIKRKVVAAEIKKEGDTIQPALGGTPIDALSAFKKAAQAKNFEATWKHVAKFDDLPDQVTEYLKGKVRRFIDYVSRGSDFEIIEEKIEGDCAVVVINESKKEGRQAFDIDPAYLIKQDGEWRVFPDLSDWDIVEHVAKDKVDSYKKLEAWYKKRKVELKKEKG